MIGQVIGVKREARKLGNVQMTNVVLLGALVKMMPFFEMEPMRNLIEELSPERFKEANIRTFGRGRDLIH